MGKSKDLSSEKKSEIAIMLKHSHDSQRQIDNLTHVISMSLNRIKSNLDKHAVIWSQRVCNFERRRIIMPRDERKTRGIVLKRKKKCKRN